jgi:DUF1009 family protein
MTGALGIIAGAGDLPVDLAERCAASKAPYFIIRLRGFASPELAAHPGVELPIGRLGAAMRVLKTSNCNLLMFVGKVMRPGLRDLSLDWTGFTGLLRLLRGWRHDDRLHRAISGLFERHGIRVVGPADIWPELLAPIGVLTARSPDAMDLNDIEIATKAAIRVGLTDRGQGAVVRRGGEPLLEDRDHTNGLLRRASMEPGNGGVLVKLAKPQQDRRLDLPVIGPETVAAAVASRLSGIAIEAGAAILARREQLIADADAAGLFVVGLDPRSLP